MSVYLLIYLNGRAVVIFTTDRPSCLLEVGSHLLEWKQQFTMAGAGTVPLTSDWPNNTWWMANKQSSLDKKIFCKQFSKPALHWVFRWSLPLLTLARIILTARKTKFFKELMEGLLCYSAAFSFLLIILRLKKLIGVKFYRNFMLSLKSFRTVSTSFVTTSHKVCWKWQNLMQMRCQPNLC